MTEYLSDPQGSLKTYFATVEDDCTVIYANFGGADPNVDQVEINVRPNCVKPVHVGINYITLEGLEICCAATQWNPPTGVQSGMVDTYWSKGWIIQNCHLHDAKTSAISLGKEVSTGNCECTRYRRKPGYQYQMEAVFKALKRGWSKELIGSHKVLHNVIHDCGENGVVGHLGCVFSEIAYNSIYNIAKKYEFFGHEIAGIKLHTAIDVRIHHNDIYNCALGIWLDWEVQGTRVSSNVFAQNTRDLMIEVTHGPCVVDNNIFASDYNFDNVAQGTALINNLFMGTTRRIDTRDRATPYHTPHSTDVAGVAVVVSGDDRVTNNIFVGAPMGPNGISVSGTAHYNGHGDSMEEYVAKAFAGTPEDHTVFNALKDPVFIKSNLYVNDAPHYDLEKDFTATADNPHFALERVNGQPVLKCHLSTEMLKRCSIVKSWDLGAPRITECPYEDFEGHEIVFNCDLNGTCATLDETQRLAGPLANLKVGDNAVALLAQVARLA